MPTWTTNIPKPPFINWAEKSANYNLVNNDGILANTLAGSFTVTLPANPSLGNTIAFSDAKSNFDVNNLIIARNGNLIQGQADDLIVDVKDASFMLIYTGATSGWKLDTFLEQTIDPINYVPTSRTINGLDLTVDRTLTTNDIADSTNKRYVTNIGRDIANNTRRLINSADSGAITGTTVPTLVSSRSFLIPANTLTANSFINVVGNTYIKTGTNGNLRLRIMLNTVDSLSGATQIAISSDYTATNTYTQLLRKFSFDGTNIKSLNLTSGVGLEPANSTAGQSTTTLNSTVDNYLIFSVQLANGSDSVVMSQQYVEICTQ